MITCDTCGRANPRAASHYYYSHDQGDTSGDVVQSLSLSLSLLVECGSWSRGFAQRTATLPLPRVVDEEIIVMQRETEEGMSRKLLAPIAKSRLFSRVRKKIKS